jgi:RimJ/RimL family protein N-acetyltransferase
MSRTDISFRPYRDTDAQALLTWAGSADELLQWAGPVFTFPLDQRQLADYAAGRHRHRRLISAVSMSGEVLGHLELRILREHNLGKIGRVAVAPHARGAGIATQMLRWLTALAFEELGLHRLELLVFSFNAPALACYERIGFAQEGVARQARKGSDGYWDVIHMALLEDSYKSRSCADRSG